ELIRTNEIDIDAIDGSIGTVGDAGDAVGSNGRTPVAVELIRFRDVPDAELTPSITANMLFNPDIEADASGDVVLDLSYFDRADADAGGDFSQDAVIRRITAGDDVSVVVNDMREGRFDLMPTDKCPSWCPVKSICRFSRFRVELKQPAGDDND
ncbi:MAG: hypothetical protein ACOC9S_00770, partial [Planctomycetota bacterium]